MLDLVHETNWKNWSKDSIKDKYYVNEEDASVFEWTVKYENFRKSLNGLQKCEMLTRQEFQPPWRDTPG